MEKILKDLGNLVETIIVGTNIMEFLSAKRYIREGYTKEDIKKSSYLTNSFLYFLSFPARTIIFYLYDKKRENKL